MGHAPSTPMTEGIFYRPIDYETVNQILDTLDYFQTRKFLKRHGKYPHFLYKFRRLQTADDMNHLREIIVRSELWWA